MKKIFALIKKLYYDKRMRFLFVGGLNTLVGLGTSFLFIFLGMRYIFDDEFHATIFAQVFSNIIGVTHSYFWNKYFTFRQKKKSLVEVLKFIAVYSVSIGLSLLINYIMVKRNGISPYISTIVGITITTILSFVGHNFFSFRQKRQNSEPDESGIVIHNDTITETIQENTEKDEGESCQE